MMLLYKNPSNVPKAQEGIKVLPSIRNLINDSMNRKLLTAQATVKPVHTMQRDNIRTPSVKINPQLAMSGAKKHMNAVSQNKAEYEASQLQSRKEYVAENMKKVYKHPLMSPGYFTPEGALIGAMQGAVKVGPDLYNKNYAAAAGDALMMLPLAPAAGKAMQRVVKAVGTESGILSKAYKLNKNAVKVNHRARLVGQDPGIQQKAAPHDLFDLNIVRKPSGSIGNQGATQEGAMSILKSIGVDVKATGTDGVSMRDMVEHLKSNPKDASKFKAFLQKEPINVNELPGGEYQINDGHHRATLSYYSGEEKIPAVIKNKGEYTTTMPTTMPTASKSLGGIIYKIK